MTLFYRVGGSCRSKMQQGSLTWLPNPLYIRYFIRLKATVQSRKRISTLISNNNKTSIIPPHSCPQILIINKKIPLLILHAQNQYRRRCLQLQAFPNICGLYLQRSSRLSTDFSETPTVFSMGALSREDVRSVNLFGAFMLRRCFQLIPSVSKI
jgi:hypothetical protein